MGGHLKVTGDVAAARDLRTSTARIKETTWLASRSLLDVAFLSAKMCTKARNSPCIKVWSCLIEAGAGLSRIVALD